jgi:hypothetical protein
VLPRQGFGKGSIGGDPTGIAKSGGLSLKFSMSALAD